MEFVIHNSHEASIVGSESEDLYKIKNGEVSVTFDYGSDEESACVVRKNSNGIWAIGGFSTPVEPEVVDWIEANI